VRVFPVARDREAARAVKPNRVRSFVGHQQQPAEGREGARKKVCLLCLPRSVFVPPPPVPCVPPWCPVRGVSPFGLRTSGGSNKQQTEKETDTACLTRRTTQRQNKQACHRRCFQRDVRFVLP
jgi:hypothetical protein